MKQQNSQNQKNQNQSNSMLAQGSKQNQQQGDWKKISQRIKTKFSKLPSSDIDKLEGHIDQLPDKVAKTYGYDRARAERECQEFMQPKSSNRPLSQR